MNFIQEFRNNHNLTQRQLARLLQIPHSQLSMAETNKRTLSGPALTRLHNLGLLREPSLIKEGYSAREKHDYLQKKDGFEASNRLKMYLKKNSDKLKLLREKLKNFELGYKKASESLALVAEQRANQSKNGDALTKSWLDGREAAAKLLLTKITLTNIELLKIKVAGIKAEIALTRRRIKELQNP